MAPIEQAEIHTSRAFRASSAAAGWPVGMNACPMKAAQWRAGAGSGYFRALTQPDDGVYKSL